MWGHWPEVDGWVLREEHRSTHRASAPHRQLIVTAQEYRPSISDFLISFREVWYLLPVAGEMWFPLLAANPSLSIFSLTHSTSVIYLIRLTPLMIWVCNFCLFTVAWLGKIVRQFYLSQGDFSEWVEQFATGRKELWFIHLSPLPYCSEDCSETMFLLWITNCWGPTTFQVVC